MLKNYFQVAFRNLIRNGIYSVINIVGFALGLAVFLLISLVVIDDLSYDRFHEDPENIYRFLTQNASNKNMNAITSGALTKEVANSIPEVIATTRVFNFGQINLTFVGGPESEAGIQRVVLGADSNFFDVFPAFTLLVGDPEQQLKTPNSAVVTQEVADALFPDENPIGQTVQGPNGQFAVTITGIIEDCPINSHLQYDIIVPALVNAQNSLWWESWNNISGWGYLRAEPGTDEAELEAKIQQVAEMNGMNEQYLPLLQPLLDVHLGSNDLRFDLLNYGKSDRTQVVMLTVIAALTLLIASFNFINLSSARAMKRAREVGMRKVVGANRAQLMFQFLGESVMTTLLATLIAGIAVEIALPSLYNFLGRELAFSLISNLGLFAGALGLGVLVGILAGLYPALVIAGFSPMLVLKGQFRSSKHGIALRQGLVVVQFAVSIALVASVIIVLQQLHYVTTMDKGYDLDQVATTFTFNPQVAPSRDVLAERIKEVPGVLAVGTTQNLPGFGQFPRYEGRGEDSPSMEYDLSFYRMRIGSDFIPALNIEMIEGRNFYADSRADSGVSVILNEAAVRALNWDDPIGKVVVLNDEQGQELRRTVVGVVKNFQVAGARQQFEPVCMEFQADGGGFLFFRLQAGQFEETIQRIQEVWNEVVPDQQFNSLFVDQIFNRQYQSDRNFATKVGVFSALAIVIAALGLLGLSSYATEQRRREVAVRKVLGSGESRIMVLLASDFVRWVLVANIIGWPIAYFAMKQWLSDFVFRVTITPLPFLLAGVGAAIIAILTVIWQAWRAALANPATVLRSE